MNTIKIKNRLKEIRLSKEYNYMTQIKFSEFLEIDFRQLCRYEHGMIPTIQTIFKISKKLGKPIEEIFYLDE